MHLAPKESGTLGVASACWCHCLRGHYHEAGVPGGEGGSLPLKATFPPRASHPVALILPDAILHTSEDRCRVQILECFDHQSLPIGPSTNNTTFLLQTLLLQNHKHVIL